MLKLFTFILILLSLPSFSQKKLNDKLHRLDVLPSKSAESDWLIDASGYKSGVYKSSDSENIILYNGLVERVFRIKDYFACYSFRNLVSGHEFIRAIRPEASIVVNGQKLEIGGVSGQFEHAYVKLDWLNTYSGAGDFKMIDFEIHEITPYLSWQPVRWIPQYSWPPKGKEMVMIWEGSSLKSHGINVEVHYEIYDGIPLISKWLKVRCERNGEIELNTISTEILAIAEDDISVDKQSQWNLPNIFVGSDYSFMGMTAKSADRVTNWLTDSLYTSQVNYDLKTPCLLETKLPIGPEVSISQGSPFTSFRIWELVFDSYERERKGLSMRKMYRTVSPWVLENPIFMHLTSTDPEVIKSAVNQCKETGFEMIILSFGSGLNMESSDSNYLTKMQEMASYCKSNGIELGGYSLLASRRINDQQDVINPKTNKPGGAVFGNSPCLGSNWGIEYFTNLQNFIQQTGFSLLEHDGSYPGDICASNTHPGHKGLLDSQWEQWEQISNFYKWCRTKDVYLNVPDWYFFAGSNKTGIGYRETNWSLPREQQIILGRQNLYDGTWEKTPSMGWTFVPLVQYQGGGEAATLEPLKEHLAEYNAHLFQNFGAGVQACYRGARLYDCDETKEVVKSWVAWYKKYREILNSDIIHLRRPDGRDWDGIMHVNPKLHEKAFILLFNPLDEAIEREISVPLYYAGIQNSAKVSLQGKLDKSYCVDEKSIMKIKVNIPANSYIWLTVK